MTNNEKLVEMVKNSGLKREFIASRMNITRQSLSNKISGRSLWTAAEIQSFCDVVGITDPKEVCEIFFADSVEKRRRRWKK